MAVEISFHFFEISRAILSHTRKIIANCPLDFSTVNAKYVEMKAKSLLNCSIEHTYMHLRCIRFHDSAFVLSRCALLCLLRYYVLAPRAGVRWSVCD